MWNHHHVNKILFFFFFFLHFVFFEGKGCSLSVPQWMCTWNPAIFVSKKNEVLIWPTSAPITGTSLKIHFWDKTHSIHILNIYALGQEISAVYIKNKVLFQSSVPSFTAIRQELRALYMDTTVLTCPHLGSYFTDVLKTHSAVTVHIL